MLRQVPGLPASPLLSDNLKVPGRAKERFISFPSSSATARQQTLRPGSTWSHA